MGPSVNRITQNILVTGVTGLIGGEVLLALVREGGNKIAALVRAQEQLTPESRFVERIGRSGLQQANGDWSCVDVVQGDLTQPGLGMTAAAAQRLTSEVDVIVHCAADTSFLREEQVRATNIEGTRHLIEFARRCHREPQIVYMSTATNMGKVTDRCLREDEGCQPDNAHHNAYTHSKAVAETMLRESGLPLLIVRPTIVLSAGLSDEAFARNILWFVPLLKRFDALPIDGTARLDVVPVSYVVEATVKLIQKRDRRHDCYHISAGFDGATLIGEYMAFVDKYYERLRRFGLIHPSEWNKDTYQQNVRTALQ